MEWKPKQPGQPGAEQLIGRHVTLRPLSWPQPGTALAQRLAGEDESLWRYTMTGPFAGPEDAAATLARQSQTMRVMALALPDGSVEGTASFMRLDETNGTCELGSIAYGAALQRTRAGTEAIYLMLEEVFGRYGWRRCEWICNARNERSFRAGLRYGFTHEGTLRQHRWTKGANRDTQVLSMLDSEWPGRKAAFEAWLEDSNFDADGRQIAPLNAFR